MSIEPVNMAFFASVQDTLRDLPTFERAEMSVGLARTYADAYAAYCGAVTASTAARSPVASPTVSTGFVYKTCGAPSRRLGSVSPTGSGYWSVPSGLSLDASKLNADGRCYLALAATGSRTALYRKLGPWPTFARLLTAPSGRLCRNELGAFSFARVSDGTWHVASRDTHEPGSTGDVGALGMLARVVDDNASELDVSSPRWDGTLLRDLQLEEVPRGALDVPALSDKVGGTGPGGGSGRCGYYSYPDDGGGLGVPLVYLGGTVEKDRSDPGWRREFVRELWGPGSPVCDFVSPRPLGGDFADADDAKRGWERGSMDRAHVILLYFRPGFVSSVSMLELGLYASSGRLVVCCPPGFRRHESVWHTCLRAGVPVFDALEAVVWHLSRALSGFQVRGASALEVGPGGLSSPPSLDLDWDCVGGVPVGSGCERTRGGRRYLAVTFLCSRELASECVYTFRVPGDLGFVGLRRAPGLVVRGAESEGDEFFRLECGKKYKLSLDFSLSVFAPTFEYLVGTCGPGVSWHQIGGLQTEPGEGELCSRGVGTGFGRTVSNSFLRLVRGVWRPFAALRLGYSPTLHQLLSLPREWYVGPDELMGYSLFRVGALWVVDALGDSVSVVGCVAAWRGSGVVVPLAAVCDGLGVAGTGYPVPGVDEVVV